MVSPVWSPFSFTGRLHTFLMASSKLRSTSLHSRAAAAVVAASVAARPFLVSVGVVAAASAAEDDGEDLASTSGAEPRALVVEDDCNTSVVMVAN
jgi:ABC-type molybdate transport system permease subunit